jgi:hypothetical protein
MYVDNEGKPVGLAVQQQPGTGQSHETIIDDSLRNSYRIESDPLISLDLLSAKAQLA